MKKNPMDLITDELKIQVEAIKNEIADQFKGTVPYRKEKVDNKQLVLEYDEFLDKPEIEQQLRQTAGNDTVEEYHRRMQKILGRDNAR